MLIIQANGMGSSKCPKTELKGREDLAPSWIEKIQESVTGLAHFHLTCPFFSWIHFPLPPAPIYWLPHNSVEVCLCKEDLSHGGETHLREWKLMKEMQGRSQESVKVVRVSGNVSLWCGLSKRRVAQEGSDLRCARGEKAGDAGEHLS